MNDLIFQTLSHDDILSALLGKICTADKEPTEIPAIYYGFSGTWDIGPCISYFLAECSDVEFADDACIASKLVYQFDVFADNASIDTITDRIDILLRQNGFSRRSGNEVLEPNVRHKRLVYYIYKEEEI